MENLKRGDKIYLDKERTKESEINQFLSCRDGVVEMYEFNSCSGYGSKTRLFLCNNTKHESIALIRQTYNTLSNKWIEESIYFDSDSFVFLEALIIGNKNKFGGKYYLVRDY